MRRGEGEGWRGRGCGVMSWGSQGAGRHWTKYAGSHWLIDNRGADLNGPL